MADEDNEEVTRTGREFLEEVWWDAIEELQMAIMSDVPSDRIAASRVLLEYTSSLNVGFHDPFIPKSRPERQVEEEDE